MSHTWQCPACFALNVGEGACRVCTGPRPGPSAVPVPARAARRRRLRLATWIAPGVLLALSLLLATGFEPAIAGNGLSILRALGHDEALRHRRAELSDASAALAHLIGELDAGLAGAPLPPRWRTRLDRTRRAYELDGYVGVPELAGAELSLRVLVLELASLHHRLSIGSVGPDFPVRVAHARNELERVTTELMDAP